MAKMNMMIFVNFKTYKQGVGEEAVKLAKICAEVEKETSIKIIPIVQAADISRVTDLRIEVWSQAAVISGAAGVLLNHSDDKLDIEVIGEEIKRIKDITKILRILYLIITKETILLSFPRTENNYLTSSPEENILFNFLRSFLPS